MSLSEIAAILGKATSTIERAVTKLQQQHRLLYEGAKKGDLCQVKFNPCFTHDAIPLKATMI